MRLLILHISGCATIQSVFAVPEDVDEMSVTQADFSCIESTNGSVNMTTMKLQGDDSTSGQFYDPFKLHAA